MRLIGPFISLIAAGIFVFPGVWAQVPAPASPTAAKSEQVMILTPEEAIRLVLTRSHRVKEVTANLDQARLPYSRILGLYDFNLSFETGIEKSKVESGTGTAFSSEDSINKTSLILAKPFPTGTTLTLEAYRNAFNFNLLPTATVPDGYHQNLVGISITQNLWRNFFGQADRAEVDSAQKAFQAIDLSRADQLEALALEALNAYWRAFVAQESFQEALATRDRYQNLIAAVRRKSRFGNASPAELPQIQAESESRVQSVKVASVEYLAAIDALNTLLDLPTGTELKFQEQLELIPPPRLQKLDPESLRATRTAQLRKEAADSALAGSESRQKSDLSLIGRLYASGTDVDTSEADQELLRADRPKYYVGVRYQYNFGQATYQEEILNRRAGRDLENARFERVRRETADSLLTRERQAQAFYSVAVSAKVQRELREKVVAELTRTYNQGRTDISILIEAMNKFFNAEINFVKSIGDYQIALNEWAALRDELIPDAKSMKVQMIPGTK